MDIDGKLHKGKVKLALFTAGEKADLLQKHKPDAKRPPQFPVVGPLFAHVAGVVFTQHKSQAVFFQLEDQAGAPGESGHHFRIFHRAVERRIVVVQVDKREPGRQGDRDGIVLFCGQAFGVTDVAAQRNVGSQFERVVFALWPYLKGQGDLSAGDAGVPKEPIGRVG